MSLALARPQRRAPRRIVRRARTHVVSRWSALRGDPEAGMTTAEYAVGTLAACTFAAVLIAVVKSGAVTSAITKIITNALSIGSGDEPPRASRSAAEPHRHPHGPPCRGGHRTGEVGAHDGVVPTAVPVARTGR